MADQVPLEQDMQVQVFVVIPVHNRREITLACLKYLAGQTFDHVMVVVVDDGSSDGTSEAISEQYPSVKVLSGDGNLWWTGAMNVGVRWALEMARAKDFVLSLNDDVSFDANYIASLVQATRRHPNNLIGSVALDEQGQHVVDGGVRINWLTAKYKSIGKGQLYSDLVSHDGTDWPVDVLPGRGTLIPVAVFRQAGLYNDQMLPHYGADYEFSRRASKNGYSLLINANSVLRSQIEATGLNNRIQSLTWWQLAKSFFMRKSPNCLWYRLNFARLSVAPHLFLPYIIFDIGRVCIGNILAQLNVKQRA